MSLGDEQMILLERDARRLGWYLVAFCVFCLVVAMLSGCLVTKDDQSGNKQLVVDIECEQVTPDGYSQKCVFKGNRDDESKTDDESIKADKQ